MTWKALLAKLLDAAESAFPKFAFLLEYLRPFLAESAPDGMIVMGDAAGGPPADLVQTVQDFIAGLVAKTSRPLVKVALRTLAALTPYLLGLVWSELVPGAPKMMAGPAPDFDAAVTAADKE